MFGGRSREASELVKLVQVDDAPEKSWLEAAISYGHACSIVILSLSFFSLSLLFTLFIYFSPFLSHSLSLVFSHSFALLAPFILLVAVLVLKDRKGVVMLPPGPKTIT